MTGDSTSETDLESQCALCKATKLASPHFGLVIPINDVVVWLEVTMMNTLVLVDVRRNMKSGRNSLELSKNDREMGARTAPHETYHRICAGHVHVVP